LTILDQTFLSGLTNVAAIIAQRTWDAGLWPFEVRVAERYNPPRDPMSLLSATDLAKAFGAQDVFEGVNLAIPHQTRIALVGPNGVGKTTLLRILAGLEQPDRGRTQRARSLRVGYLPQETLATEGRQSLQGVALWDYCVDALAELRSQEAELARLENAMADPHQAVGAMARYGPLQEAFERAGGYAYPARVRRVLNGLGFTPSADGVPLGRLSGGERTRIELARLLLEDPDLLILDEPTNHLDVEAVEWLEGWLVEWPGSALVVSHDRYLLDRVAEAVWELTPHGLEAYRGNYTAYVRQRQERRAFQQTAFDAQQEHVRKEQEYIRRNIAGQNTRQAQGRRKRLERMLRDEIVDRPETERTVHLALQAGPRSGDLVLQTEALQVGYADDPSALFAVPDLVLKRGECAALIGPNGAGKTTFLKTILAETPAYSGSVRMGAGLQVGYFAQAHQGLDSNRTVLQEIQEAAPRWTVGQGREFLARFLFTGDSIDKTIGVLSGGERGRVALAKLAVQGANLLLLDEPTNHLDLPSQEILQAALQEFPGTILLVSHDRYLVNALATQVWAIHPGTRRMQVFSGNYSAYAVQRKLEEGRARVAEVGERRRDRPRRRDSGEAELRAAEDRIAAMEAELEDLARGLEVAGSDVGRVSELGARYASLQEELDAELERWERLARGSAPPA
jgi:ATP-binding cassette, subfamily F, member 3